MQFADIHCHALYGVDDGARTADDMCVMLDAVYQDGTRWLCLTPHYHPGYYGDNRESSLLAFEQLSAYAAEHYPDMTLALGNELHYAPTSTTWLREGQCRTLNATRYVLVDFSAVEEASTIIDGVTRLIGGGYRPILAHVERYVRLSLRDIETIKGRGVLLQINAGSLVGLYGRHSKHMARRLIRERYVDMTGSDCHDLQRRIPGIAEGYAYIQKHTDDAYAEHVCLACAHHLLFRPKT